LAVTVCPAMPVFTGLRPMSIPEQLPRDQPLNRDPWVGVPE